MPYTPHLAAVVGGKTATQPTKEAKLCALAQKVPQVARGLSKAERDYAELDRTTLQACIDTLWKYPQLRAKCRAYLDKEVQELTRDDQVANSLWPEAVKTIGKVLSGVWSGLGALAPGAGPLVGRPSGAPRP